MTANKITLTGWDAINAKYQDESVVLCSYNTPIDPSAEDITADMAHEIAAEDPTLIWCEIEVADPDRLKSPSRKRARALLALETIEECLNEIIVTE